MNVELLKQLGNIGQIAGIRESRLLRGRGEGIAIAEFYNAAGLRFTVVPDRCMDLFDLSYKGVNLGFQSKNGLTSPQAFCPSDGEFSEQWPGGMLVTCGLGNVGGHATNGGQFPTHGRISHVPAQNSAPRPTGTASGICCVPAARCTRRRCTAGTCPSAVPLRRS